MGGDWHQATGMEDIRRCECLSVPFRVGCLLIFFAQDQLMTRAPTCQRCQSLRHECYGLPDWVCGRCQCDKKTCQDVVVEGKATSHSTTRPCARKVTRVASPTPEVAEVEVPPPPIAGPSRAAHLPLFVDSVGSGDDHIERGAPASSGE